MSARIIRVVTAVIRDREGRLLLVRKHGTRAFMQPGGKPEPGEDPRVALVRELKEEIAVEIDPAALDFLGCYRAPAANEADHVVEAEMFRLKPPAESRSAGKPTPASEIAELWWRPDDDASERPIAPLTCIHVVGRL